MDFTEEDVKAARSFLEFYIDKLENYRNYFRYYLSEDIVLDWFGHTVKGEKNVVAFLKKTISTCNHLLSNAVPAAKIGFRNTHTFKIPKDTKSIPFSLLSPTRTVQLKSETKTPKKQPIPSTSYNNNQRDLRSKHSHEEGQGDGFHNSTDSPTSPLKKLKTTRQSDIIENLETMESESDSTQSSTKVKYVVSEGFVEFHKPSLKKYQPETKWKRPCKLSVAYTNTNSNDYTIYLIIYEGNVKCRRNLLKEFEAESPER